MILKQEWIGCLLIPVFIALLLIAFSSELYSQNIRINYINTDNYPVIEAGFIATNNEGGKIFNSSKSDFLITEYNNTNEIVEVINPQQNYEPVSIVVMIDISLSMQGRRLNLVKQGLVDFIDQIPLETSEIAIACFSDETYIYTDFTQSKNRLISAINRLQNINGTNFNGAFMDETQGALAIGQNSRHKKVIVFITDGLGTTDTQKVSSLAKEMGSTVFTLNIDLAIPQDLKEVTLLTGGDYFEKINNTNQFRSATASIFSKLKCTDYGIVKWLSKLDCYSTKPVQLKYRKALFEFEYDVPPKMVGKIDVNPSLIQFGASKVGMEHTQNLSLVTHNIPIKITALQIDSSQVFRISDSVKFPRIMKAGEQFRTKISFSAKEAGLYASNMKISSEECPEITIPLKAGGEEQIQLIFPKGGEVFTVGADTSIIWEGVKRTQNVEISYRLNENSNWKTLANASNLKYLWNLPLDTSSRVQVKLSPLKQADENMEVTAIIDGNNSQVLNTSYSSDGTRIITTDKNGFVKTWNTETGKIITSLGGYDAKKAVMPDNERLFLFLKDETFVWNITQDKLVGRVLRIGKKVNTSYILPDGSEVLTGGNISTDPAKNTRVWTGLNSYKTFLLNQPDLKWASFTPNGHMVVTLDEKNTIKIFNSDSAKLIHTFPFKETVNEVIVSPDGSKALVRLPQSMVMIDLLKQSSLFTIHKSYYKQFTSSGELFITENADKSLTFWESSSGKQVLTLAYTKFYELSKQSKYVFYSRQDSMFLYNLQEQKHTITATTKPVRLATFDGNDSKVYVLTINNTLEIYDTSSGAFLGTIEGFSRRINELVFNPAKHQFAALTEDNRLEVWSPAANVVKKEVTSGRFTIASPKPMVLDTIMFDEQQLNSAKELNIQKFAWNTTKFPLAIKNINIAGKNTGDFEVVSKIFPQQINSNGFLSQEFRFKPTETGVREARIWSYTATDSFLTVIMGKGVQQTFKPLLRYLNFGKVKVGTAKDSLVAVMVNTGKDTVTKKFQNTGPDESQFEITNRPYAIAPGDTLKAVVSFKPVSRGKTTTALTSSEELRIIARGVGIAPREIILMGVTRNSADSVPVVAKVIKTDISANLKMEEVTTDNDGKFQLKLAADRNFGITALKENYISESVNIDLSETTFADTIYKDIYLTEIKPGAVIRFNCIFFEYDKADLLPGSQTYLKRLLEIIQTNKHNTFEIHGHTDSNGSDTYNITLAKARAMAVMNYLIKNDAAKERLSIRYFGESKPVSTNSTEEGRALNRRVELKVIK